MTSQESIARCPLVFVYGSLKAGFHNHRLLIDRGAAPMESAVTKERYLLTKGTAFPFLIKNPGMARVAGELYRIDADCLASLDRLESHPNFYKREVIIVQWQRVESAAWCYFLNINRRLARLGPDELCEPDAQGVVEWTQADVAGADDGEE